MFPRFRGEGLLRVRPSALRPPHLNAPPHLAIKRRNDRLGSRFRPADVLLRHSRLGGRLIEYERGKVMITGRAE